MRVVIFSLIFYAAIALQPVQPIPTQAAAVVSAAKFLKGSAAKPIGKRRHRRRRVKRVVYVKPVTVYVKDRVQVIEWREYWRGVEAARAMAWVRWF
jgi:hypothetical protein